MSARRKRMGRPVKAPPESGTVWLSHRVPAELKRKLEAAALKSNRSLSAETARRLEITFGMPRIEEKIRLLLHAIALLEEARGTTWRDDPETCKDVLGLIEAFFRRFGPPEIKDAWPGDPLTWMDLSRFYDRQLDRIIQSFTVTPSKKPEGEQT